MAVAVECMCWECEHWDLRDGSWFIACRCELLDRYTAKDFACMWSDRRPDNSIRKGRRPSDASDRIVTDL